MLFFRTDTIQLLVNKETDIWSSKLKILVTELWITRYGMGQTQVLSTNLMNLYFTWVFLFFSFYIRCLPIHLISSHFHPYFVRIDFDWFFPQAHISFWCIRYFFCCQSKMHQGLLYLQSGLGTETRYSFRCHNIQLFNCTLRCWLLTAYTRSRLHSVQRGQDVDS